MDSPVDTLARLSMGRYIPWESLESFEIISRLFERIGRNRPRMGWHPTLPVHVSIYTLSVHVGTHCDHASPCVLVLVPALTLIIDEMTLA